MHVIAVTVTDKKPILFKGSVTPQFKGAKTTEDLWSKVMANWFYNERRTTMNNELSDNDTTNDFSSIYTAKSGTPLSYKMRGMPEDALDELALSLTPRPSTFSAWYSKPLSEDVSELTYDFCNKHNIKDCLVLLDQQMRSLNLEPLFFGETVDIVRFINNTHELIKEWQKIGKQLLDHREVQKKMESDANQSSYFIEKLKASLDDSERQKTRLELSIGQLRGDIRDLSEKLKTEKDEVRRLDCVMRSREAQYKHEARKKEQELSQMKDRMHRLITDKSNMKPAGFQISKPAQSINRNEPDLCRSLVGAYEEREKMLLLENAELRQSLVDLHHELSSVLTSYDIQSLGYEEDPHQCNADESSSLLLNSTMQSASDNFIQACHHMPFDLISDNVISNLREKCHLMKALLIKKDDSKSVGESLRLKLQEYSRQLALQSLSDADEISFLVDTNHLEERDDVSSKQALLCHQRLQLDEERQKLVDYAMDLAKQRSDLEQMKLEVLHKEFNLMSPFQRTHALLHSSTKMTPGVHRDQDDLPSTVDLKRQLERISSTSANRDFISITRSAIREGLRSVVRSTSTAQDLHKIKTVLFN